MFGQRGNEVEMREGTKATEQFTQRSHGVTEEITLPACGAALRAARIGQDPRIQVAVTIRATCIRGSCSIRPGPPQAGGPQATRRARHRVFRVPPCLRGSVV